MICRKSDAVPTKAWGMISAALGKKANISRYCQILSSIGFDFNYNAIAQRKNQYSEYRKKFLAQYEKVKSFRDQLDFIKAAEQELNETESKLKKAEKDRREVEYEIACAEDKILRIKGKYPEIVNFVPAEAHLRLQENQRSLEELKRQAISLDSQINQLKSNVSLFQRLFKTKAYRNNLVEQEKLNTSKTALQKAKETQATVCQAAEDYYNDVNAIESLEKEKADLKDKLTKNIQTTHNLEENRSALTEKCLVADNGKSDNNRALSFNKAYVEALLSEKETTAKHDAHKSVPWITNAFDREREKLFYYALKLTKEFVVNSKALKTNFKIFVAYNNKSERKNLLIKDIDRFIIPVFQSLFLLTPVVSSTLASISRMFDRVSEPNVIGYLLIDEAGQAVPYSALGAIHRASRVIATGDPKQIFPVETDDMMFINKLHSFENTARYNSSTISVQSFIDQLNPFGTIVDGERVGCPLVVHRRCASPMFDICNQISYEGTMINETDYKKPSDAKWIQCAGSEKGKKNHYVDAHGKKVCELIKQRLEKNPNEKIFIISPFKTVVNGIKEAAAKENNLLRKVDVGTVHTFQGKEAETVILVLGCDRNTGEATKKFVGKNIVNVAASRAKLNFFVVGDAQAWSVNESIMRMKKILDAQYAEQHKE